MELESRLAWRATSSAEDQRSGADPGALITRLEAVVRVMPGADLPKVARSLAMSVRSLQRALSECDTSFNAVRDRVRLLLARQHLQAEHTKVESVAREVGFASTGHFCHWFRMRTGDSPGAHRRGYLALGGQHTVDVARVTAYRVCTSDDEHVEL